MEKEVKEDKKENPNKAYMKFVKYIVGWAVLILGLTLNLMWWDDFMLLLRGVAGITIAFCGLLLIYSLNKK